MKNTNLFKHAPKELITKDRYTKAFAFLTAGVATTVYFLRNDRGYLAAASLLIGVAPILYLYTRPAKLNLSDEQKKKLSPEYKEEYDCNFNTEYKAEVDGIKVKGKRYKFVNGTDVFINEQNEVLPCGIGSSIMQVVGGGGLEPNSLQTDV